MLAEIALSFDSLLVCAALGGVLRRGRDRVVMAGLFGACDGVASLYAPYLQPHADSFAVSLAPALVVLVYSVLLLIGVQIAMRWRLLWLLPVLCAVDNLLVPLQPGQAAVAGAISALLALAGLVLGGLLNRALPFSPPRYAGLVLMGAAVAMLGN